MSSCSSSPTKPFSVRNSSLGLRLFSSLEWSTWGVFLISLVKWVLLKP
uniref:Uncharacterized protein n=1 Tax=Rhizophora mucronata TaxID=61149 RepID=A0A2P2NY72_RHIMU